MKNDKMTGFLVCTFTPYILYQFKHLRTIVRF